MQRLQSGKSALSRAITYGDGGVVLPGSVMSACVKRVLPLKPSLQLCVAHYDIPSVVRSSYGKEKCWLKSLGLDRVPNGG